MFTKENLKRTFGVIKKVFFVIFIIIFVIFGIFILIPEKYYQKFNEWFEEKAAQKIVEELERPYKEDTYGGKTPEETFQLFIDALKKGDVELASKYFVIDQQKEKLERLLKYKEKNAIDSLINDLINNFKEVEPLYKNSKRYVLVDDKGNEFAILNIVKNINNLWKLDGIF